MRSEWKDREEKRIVTALLVYMVVQIISALAGVASIVWLLQ